MSLETATYINQLNPLNPDGSVDLVSTSDDHLRLIKTTIQNSFPNITGPVIASQDDLSVNNYLLDTGTVNAIVVSPNPAWSSYATGKGFTFKAANSITSLTPTIKVNSLSPIIVTNADGSLPQIKANGFYTVRYDGTNFRIFGQSSNDFIQGDVNIKGSTTDAVITNYNAGDLILKTNTTEKVRITSTGNVGIGKTPLSNVKLDVEGLGRFVSTNSGPTTIGAVTIRDYSTNNSSGYVQWVDNTNTTQLAAIGGLSAGGLKIINGISEVMRIDSVGNVGIGTSNPTCKLDVKGLYGGVGLSTDSGGSVSIGRSDNVASSPYIDFNTGSTTIDYDTRIQASGGNGTTGNGNLAVLTGKVGIGAVATTEKLEVTGNIKAFGNISSTGNISATGNISVSGNILVTTPAVGDNTTKVATTEFVQTNATRPKIDQVTDSGWNGVLFLSEGKVYEAHGSDGSFYYPTTGRGFTGQVAPVSLECITQIAIPDGSPIVKIVGGHYSYAAALTASGNLYTWGENDSGECGLGHTSTVPFPAFAASGVTDIYETLAASSFDGRYVRLIIKKSDGYLYGAGYNGNGQLGIGNVTNQPTFVQITAAGTNPKFVGNLGGQYGCLIVQKSDNTIFAAGYNGNGVLGTGSVTPSPYYVSSLTNVTTNWNGGDNAMVIQQIDGGLGWNDSSSNAGGNLIMLLDNGTSSLVKTCGYNNYGSIGNGSTGGNVALPNTVSSAGARIVKVGSMGGGVSSVYGLASDGNLFGWGYNASGQLGTGNTTQQNSPILISSNVTNFFCGEPVYGYQYYSGLFVQKTDGLTYATGYNANGELGIGNQTNQTTLTMVRLPVQFGSWKFGSFSTTSATYNMIAISPKNTIYAWGYNGNYGVSYNYTTNLNAPIIVELKRGD